MGPLRLMIYDRTCTTAKVKGLRAPLGLTHSWIAGGRLYGALGRIDAHTGVASWAEALEWLGTVEPDRPIAEIQFWGHGQRGRVKIDAESLDASALAPGHPLRPALERIRERLAPDALWWFRTCDTFGAHKGQDFARRWTDFFGCAAAGHTYIIGPWQSGLHRLGPGAAPHWSASEGLASGTPEQPGRSAWSTPWLPNTITCLDGVVPLTW